MKKKKGVVACPFCEKEVQEPEVFDIPHTHICLASYILVADADKKIREFLREGKSVSTIERSQGTIVFAK